MHAPYPALETKFAWSVFALNATLPQDVFCRPDQFGRSSYVDKNSCLLVSSLPFYLPATGENAPLTYMRGQVRIHQLENQTLQK
jgi:hypothetical protein